MAILTDYLSVDILIGLLTVTTFLYFYLKNCNKYWKHRGVPYVKPHLFFGNLKDTFLGRKSLVDIYTDLYNELSGHPFGGCFELISPILMIRDPELIERILVKDFSHFMDRSFIDPDVENDPLSTGLSNLSGDLWRTMRYKLTPTFTTGKLKGMFEQIYNCGDELLEELAKYSDRKEDVEAKTVLTLFTTDVIASCAFGLQFDHESEEGKTFRDMAEKIFIPSIVQRLKFFILIFSKRLTKIFGNAMFPKDVTEYYVNMTKATIEQRTKNRTERNDFLQLLMNLREQDKTGKVTDISAELKGEDEYLKQDNFKPTKDSAKLGKQFTFCT